MSWGQLETRSYWLVLVVSFLALAMLESRRPRLTLRVPAERRWPRHGILMLFYSFVWTAVYRTSPVLVAVGFASSSYGLLNRPALPYAVRFVLTILVLDFVRYVVHWTEHHVGWLWRVHQVHHSDPDFDVSTGFRAHPLEVLITQGATLAAVAILAPPPLAVLSYELMAAFESSFGHANLVLPHWLETRLRAVWVTPGMHRIHHSQDEREQMRNLGDLFPWWDRLFGTYLARPAAGDASIVVGMRGFQTARSVDFRFMLAQPFLKEAPAAGGSEADPFSGAKGPV
jgi:sterol desaturase/sphingolipid hydroxylase (fatty acid hydroxylase superfamily)